MELSTAKGVRDFPPEEMILRQQVIDTLRRIFERFGFNPLETPIVERYDVLASKYAGGSEILKEVFRLTDQGGRDLCLRYDLTVPLSRFVGMNPNLKMPFKRYEIGRVYRDGPIKLGRYREFWQCDVDIVGSKSLMADAEVLTLSSAVFSELGMPVEIKVSSRKLIDGILDFAGVPAKKRIDAILSIDKLEKYGIDAVRKELEEKGVSDDSITRILGAIECRDSNETTLDNLKSFLTSESGKQGIAEMEELLSFLEGIEVTFDPSLARGLAYYTGPVFEIFLKGSNIKSAAAGGGRYDRMVGQFVGQPDDYPATGIAFGLEVITDAMKDAASKKKSVVKVYIIPIGTQKECIAIAKRFRQAGIPTDIDIMGRGISKNLKFANSFGIPYVVFAGEDELKQKKVKLRNMESGEESLLSLDEAISKVAGKP